MSSPPSLLTSTDPSSETTTTTSTSASSSRPYLRVNVSNVKGHFYVKAPVLPPKEKEDQDFVVKYHGNFWSVKLKEGKNLLQNGNYHSNFVYIVFPQRGYVNVSGIQDFNECNLAKVKFERLFNTRAKTGFRVDNSTASGHLPFDHIHLPDLLEVRRTHHSFPCTISLRPHYFPAVLIRPLEHIRRRQLISTCILFANGKFIVVGSKSPAQTAHSVHNLQQLVYAADSLPQHI